MNFESRVLPELRAALAQFPGFQLEEKLAWSRSLLSNPPIEKSEHVHTTSQMIPGAAGEMLVKVYEPCLANGRQASGHAVDSWRRLCNGASGYGR